MKITQLGLFVILFCLHSSCHEPQVDGKIDIATILESPIVNTGSSITLHWYVEVQDQVGIEHITLRFSDTHNDLNFPNIFQPSWIMDDVVKFDAHAVPESWTITVIVQDQEGNISEEASTIQLQ